MDGSEDRDSMDIGIEDENSSSNGCEYLLEHSNSWQIEGDITIAHITIVDLQSKEVLAESEIGGPEKSEDEAVTVPDEKDEPKSNLIMEEKGFRCEICYKTFSSKSSLNRHQLIHMTKRFKCDVCEKEFTYKCNLDVHKLNHSGVRAFKCEECGKEFTQKCRLTSHQLIHSGVKAFMCETCGKTFISKSTLNRHKMTHSGIKRFKCDDCGREFNEKCNLEVHQLTHSGIKPFKCDICGRMFSRKYTLNTHMTIHRRKGEITKSEELNHKRNLGGRNKSTRLDDGADKKTGNTLLFDDDDEREDTEDGLQLDDDIAEDISDPLQLDDHMKNVNSHDPLGLNGITTNGKHERSPELNNELMLDEEIEDSVLPENEFNMKRIVPLTLCDDTDFSIA